MKKTNLSKYLIIILLSFLLFQDLIESIIKINFIGYIDEIFIIAFFILSIINILSTKKINVISIYLILFLLLFSILGIISCYINSSFNLKNVILSNFISIKFWLLVFSIINLNFKEKTLNNIKDSLEFLGFVVASFAIVNLVLQDKYYSLLPISPMYRFGIISVNSLFGHPGRYGWFMLFMTIYYFSQYKINNKKEFLSRMIVFAVLSLLSLRTKVIIGLVMILLVDFFVNRKFRFNFKKIFIVIFITGLLLFSFKNVIKNTYKLYFNDNEKEARVVLNKQSIYIMKRYFPFGVGFGKYGSYLAKVNYSEYYYLYGFYKIYGLKPQKSNYATDTFWPAIIGETGFLGLVLYIGIMLYLLNYLKKSYLYNKTIFGIFGFLAYIQSICESLGEPSFNSPPQNVFLAIVVGLSISTYLIQNKIHIENNIKEFKK